jgi:hypothetical protein
MIGANFSRCLGAGVAALWLLNLAVAPAQSESALRGGHAPWSEDSEPPAIPDSQPAASTAKRRTPTPAPAAFQSAASKVTGGAPVAKRAKPAAKRSLRPVGYETSETVGAAGPGVAPAKSSFDGFDNSIPALDTRPAKSAGSPAAVVEELAPSDVRYDRAQSRVAQAPQDDLIRESPEELEERRAKFRAQLTRPFKKMREIHPFFDYEPDQELAASDRCNNLCPRPGGADCPECVEPGPDGVPEGRLPCPECPVEINLRETNRLVGSINDFPTRSFPHINYCWEATNLYAYPLYFEDHCLERYGHTRNILIQPVFSVGLFAAQFVGLPYQMTIDPIFKKRYALGWYRPGQYVPYKYYQVPWNTEAAVVEAGVIAGSYFLFAPGVGP